MGVDHLGVGQLRQETERAARASRRVAKATLQNASIGRAGIRVYDGGWIRIEDGGLQVTGTASVTGTLTGSGTFDWTGPMNLQGAQTITGPTTFTGQMTVNGPWKFVGNGQITGDVTLTGDFEVLPGGRFKIGNMIIDPSDGGSVAFPGGAVVKGQAGNGVEVTAGPYSAMVRSGYARIGTSALNFEIDGFTGLSINGVQEASGLGTPVNTLHVLPGGQLRKSSGL